MDAGGRDATRMYASFHRFVVPPAAQRKFGAPIDRGERQSGMARRGRETVPEHPGRGSIRRGRVEAGSGESIGGLPGSRGSSTTAGGPILPTPRDAVPGTAYRVDDRRRPEQMDNGSGRDVAALVCPGAIFPVVPEAAPEPPVCSWPA